MKSCCYCYLGHHIRSARYSINMTCSNLTLLNVPIIIMPDFFSSVPYHVVFGFLIPLLVSFLQMSIQGTTKSLSETHSLNMCAFLLATFIYCFSFAAEMKFRLYHSNYFQLFSAIAIISGIISSTSLVSMILPRSGEHISYMACILVLIIVGYQHAILVKDVYNRFSQKFYEVRARFKEDYLMEQLQLPV